MSPYVRIFFSSLGAFALIILVGLFLTTPSNTEDSNAPLPQAASAVETQHVPPSEGSRKKQALEPDNKEAQSPTPTIATSTTGTTPSENQSGGVATRLQNPYPFPPLSSDFVNTETRAALVNILCMTKGGSVHPTSGSGVVIDPRGLILTNAHVAQYVLLAESGEVNLSCMARAGSPARPVGELEVVYIPPVWIEEHAADIASTSPTGTGEHDYAFLRIAEPWNGGFLPLDARDGIGFSGDQVLAASYPAEFIGALGALNDLYPVSSIASIHQLLTFSTDTVDLIAVAGVIEAQSGSSGGPLVNAWGQLIGIITTTSNGVTTAQRELRALTLSYINRDLLAQSGFDLTALLGKNITAQAAEFKAHVAQDLVELLLSQISKKTH